MNCFVVNGCVLLRLDTFIVRLESLYIYSVIIPFHYFSIFNYLVIILAIEPFSHASHIYGNTISKSFRRSSLRLHGSDEPKDVCTTKEHLP